jgi:hypothetical protein
MTCQTITINHIDLDVYYTCNKCTDAYGTGDSPTMYEIDIIAIEPYDSTINIMSLLCESTIQEVEDEILVIEKGN